MKLRTKLMCGLLAFGTAATTYAQERFNVYGYMDFNYQHRIGLEASNPLLGENFIENEPTLTTGNVNLYFDFHPTENTRALIETNLNYQVEEQSSSAGAMNNITFAPLTSAHEAMLPSIGSDGKALINPSDGKELTIAEVRALEGVDIPGVGVAIPVGSADQMVAGYQDAIRSSIAKAGGVEEKAYRPRSFHKGIDLERAWIEYSMNDQVNFRFGQFITPAGIWNVDHGSPIITTVGQPNQTSFFPIFPEKQQGAMLHGTMFIGDDDLAYNAYVSTGRYQPSSDGIGAVESDQDLSYDDHAIGGHLAYKTYALDGVTVGASGMMGTIRDDKRINKFVREFSADEMLGLASGTFAPGATEFINYEVTPAVYRKEYIGGLDLKAEYEGFTFQGEVNYRWLVNQKATKFAARGAATEFLGYYGLVSYKVPLTDKSDVSPYTLFEQISWDNPHYNFPGLAGFPINGWNTIMAGLNFGIGSNFHIKMEYAYGQLLVHNPSDWDSSLTDVDFDQGDLDLHTVSTQFTMAF